MSKLRLAITHVTVEEQENELSLAQHKEFCALLASGSIAAARANLATRLDAAEQALCGSLSAIEPAQLAQA